jgi:hypothetical protein
LWEQQKDRQRQEQQQIPRDDNKRTGSGNSRSPSGMTPKKTGSDNGKSNSSNNGRFLRFTAE